MINAYLRKVRSDFNLDLRNEISRLSFRRKLIFEPKRESSRQTTYFGECQPTYGKNLSAALFILVKMSLHNFEKYFRNS